ncbi:MAG: hypothetical protein VKP62_12890, partial [Candidatus Sericytochromatia bacterium]|nr:hypothetical protein [Candidatus Sericytochromatia bacterium]
MKPIHSNPSIPPAVPTPLGQKPALTPPTPKRDQLVLSREARNDDPLAQLRKTVERISRSGGGMWTANDGYCMDLSAKWQTALQLAGIETRMVVVDPAGGPAVAHTLAGREAHGKTHAFLIFQYKGQEYILDPTVQQFFKGGGRNVPPIFIGTRDEAAALFTREQELLQIEIDADVNTGRHDPLAFTNLVYGLGQFRKLRIELAD